MDSRSVEELRNELERLMGEQIESLKAQTFGGLNEEQLREQAERLKSPCHPGHDRVNLRSVLIRLMQHILCDSTEAMDDQSNGNAAPWC
jgi:hypothetical protein